jgi:phospholipase C
MPKVEHIVVLMMENHSFDNILGLVPQQVPGRAAVDGLRFTHGRAQDFNRDPSGRRVFANHATSPCQLPTRPNQDWNASHVAYNGGRMDGFVRASGADAMWYWDARDIPITYGLARHFPIGQRYFCSTLCQTYPNRRFFFCGTASGLIATDGKTFSTHAANGTIFDRLDAHGISSAVYYQNLPSPAIVPGLLLPGRGPTIHKFPEFYLDAAAGKLPQFTFLDPNYSNTSQEDPQDIDYGEKFIGEVVHALVSAPTWKHTVLFLTYDEHGGYYDHVPPPRAIKPDAIAPMLKPGMIPGAYDRYGFRVPMIVVSPWARANYISSIVQDHTSMDAFIERKWNLPAMTYRDANADAMTDYFDFSHAAFAQPPALPGPPSINAGLRECRAAGYKPPLPPMPSPAQPGG